MYGEKNTVCGIHKASVQGRNIGDQFIQSQKETKFLNININMYMATGYC